MSAARRDEFQSSENILPTDLMAELLRLSGLLEDAMADYQRAATEYGVAEHEYRHAKAVSYLAAVNDDKNKPRKEQRTVPALRATMDIECEQERLRERLAKARKDGLKEVLESRRTQLSVLQTVANSVRAELELAGRGPRME